MQSGSGSAGKCGASLTSRRFTYSAASSRNASARAEPHLLGYSMVAFSISAATGFRSFANTEKPSRAVSNGMEPPPAVGSRIVTSSALARSEEHTSELQSLMRISYAVFCLKTQNTTDTLNLYHSADHYY